jgi:nicotinate-nucleotide--dimethylbenzimidazole phosphoribosyltransferase
VTFAAAVDAVVPVDEQARSDAQNLSDHLTKPIGALGALETIGATLAAIAGISPPPVPEPAAVAVFAADHGVVGEAVTPWPAEVTAQMVANICAGGAAISVLARHAGAQVTVVDVGVQATLDSQPSLVEAKVRPGTGNLAEGPAMTATECGAALDVGAEVARQLTAAGARCLVTGDMGIGNTTAAAAVIAALCHRSAGEVTGRGTGIDDEMLAHKTAVVDRALARLPERAPAADVLAEVGGLEIAALAGFIVGGAAARVPVIVDGVIACAALTAAAALVPDAVGYCVAGHLSSEPGARVALEHVGLDPVLDLHMRLGEGTGACLALPVVQASAKILREMATFDSAGVTEK